MPEYLFMADEDGVAVHITQGCSHPAYDLREMSDEYWIADCVGSKDIIRESWAYFLELDECTFEEAAEWTVLANCCPPDINEKMDRFIAAARRHGWEIEVDDETVEALRGDEVLLVIWNGGRWEPYDSSYTEGDKEKMVPNLATALRILAEPPFVNGHRKFVPFSVDGATDEEVFDAVIGRRLTWLNSLTNELENARLLPDGRSPKTGKPYHIHTHLTESSEGRRILTFVDQDGSGFRSVALDALIRVRG